jgi:hypothetical protein
MVDAGPHAVRPVVRQKSSVAAFRGVQVAPGRSSAGAQQMQRREEIEAARRPPGFRVGDAVPASWDADEDHKLAGTLPIVRANVPFIGPLQIAITPRNCYLGKPEALPFLHSGQKTCRRMHA